ncbi:NADH oxidase [Zhongshania aliphaticivorans]|uniref:NADH oxidase n=1 Tax=Zhongshania aliphaticivorans TaxID=1470434 RepID=A0A5S9QVL7_9GAMM|nr:NADH:flavin oxidoreductase [Zhongshania aliphaticivorans]CAA0111074.1 NADH oxidase [Zhongshania aliphaticivorans]CAA0118436.1 NADH oxidase [Zhongshania aliphaticivorans]CAA0122473.1 NADH oxidase [Zhongshania aliphaticivorans]
MNTSALFTPFELGNLKLANRTVMAPMTRGFSPNGVPTDAVAEYYRKRAEGGVGLIITEGTLINHPAASGDPSYPSFYGEEALAGWKKVVDAVHAAGGKIIPQIWHVGATRRPGTGPVPDAPSVSPSGLVSKDKKVFEALSLDEINVLIAAYAQAAYDAKEIGFDGVEIHGAHGYLIDQFFWADTNVRTDQYGGSLQARSQFAIDIIKAIRERCGSDFTIIFRWSQWKQQDYTARLTTTPEELAEFLTPLSDAGVDIFHCSQRRFWEPEFEGSDMNLAGWTKKITGKPTISVGSVGLDQEFLTSFQGEGASVANIDNLLEKMNSNEFDLIAIGRSLLANPDWVNKVKAGQLDELKPFTQENISQL